MNNQATVSDLKIVRMFDAPRELVWKLWTEPEHFMRWWGPKEFTSPTCEIDLQIGGKHLFCMVAPDGQRFWTAGNYTEIIPLEKLVYTDYFADENGNEVSPTIYGMDESVPTHTIVSVLLEEQDGKTKMTLIHSSVAGAEGAEIGWGTSFDKFQAALTVLQMSDKELQQFDRLVGTWKLSGDSTGQITYEWMDGCFFLIQHVDITVFGRPNKGVEIIGRELPFGATMPSDYIKSRFYGHEGATFDYIYELEGDTLIIWGGEKGSPAYYKGTFNAEGNVLTGGWVWPGGGYSSTATRIK